MMLSWHYSDNYNPLGSQPVCLIIRLLFKFVLICQTERKYQQILRREYFLISARVGLVGTLHWYPSSLAPAGFCGRRKITIGTFSQYCGMVVGLDLALGQLVEKAKDILG